MADDRPREVLSKIIDDASRLLLDVGDTMREQAVDAKNLFDEKMRERELNKAFQQFGKAVFQQVARGNVELPPELHPQLETLRDRIKEVADATARRAEKAEKGSASATPTDATPPSQDSEGDAEGTE